MKRVAGLVPWRPARAGAPWIAAALLALAAACGGGGGGTGGDDADTAAPPDATGEVDGAVDTTPEEVADDTVADTAPETQDDADAGGVPCATDQDCADALGATLEACRVATCSPEGLCAVDPAEDGAACDDGLACTVDDACAAGACTGTARTCDDGDPCTDDACDEAAPGGCTATPNAAPCDDGDPCTTGDTCSEGACAGAAVDCSSLDGACTAGTCDPADGSCVTAPVADGTACDDADACTGPDACLAGACTGKAVSCDDANPCTLDACDAAAGCQNTLDPKCTCLVDADCASFDTPGLCDGTLRCVGGACVPDPATVVPCDTASDPLCQASVCDTATGQCALAPSDGGACDDGDPCTSGDTCTAGVCGGTDNGLCTPACVLTGEAGDFVSCSLRLARLGEASPAAASLGLLVIWEPTAATLVELVDPWCIGEACSQTSLPTGGSALKPSGHAVYLTPAAPAAWAGTLALQIAHVTAPDAPISPAWIDGDAVEGEAVLLRLRFQLAAKATGLPVLLTGLDAAGPGGAALAASVVGDLIVTTDAPCGDTVCWDGSACTADTCDAGACSFDPLGGPCDDGNPCTVGDLCSAQGQCLPGTPATPGTACTGDDKCAEVGTCSAAGACVLDPGLAVTCDTGDDPCLGAACDPATGACVTTPLPGGPCDDGDACTAGDACGLDGSCAGGPVACDDGVGCTLDGCDPATGCTATPLDAACDDGNPCTDATCSAETGCVVTANTAGCDDGDPCTTGDACQGGACTGAIDPACGCVETADCAPLEDGDPCNGTFVCDAGSCAIDPDTVVDCPPDGFACQQAWTCNPATGACEGTPVTCDDGDPCTLDTCSPTKGCLHEPTDGCVIGSLCTLSGAAGALVECPLRLARALASDPAPTGGDLKLTWDGAKARLDNLSDTFCVGAACFPFDLVQCDPSGAACSVQKLEPTGHDVIVVPDAAADWSDWLSLLVFHAGEASAPITEAVVQPDGSLTGDPLVLTVRFELLEAVPAGTPVQVQVSDQHFNPATGLEMATTLVTLDGATTFLVTSP